MFSCLHSTGLTREAQKKFLTFYSKIFCLDFLHRRSVGLSFTIAKISFLVLFTHVVSSYVIGSKYRCCQTHSSCIQVTVYKYSFDWHSSRSGMSDPALAWHVRCHIRQCNTGNLRNLHNLLLHLQWAFHVQEIFFRTEFLKKMENWPKKFFICALIFPKQAFRKTQNHRKVTIISARTKTKKDFFNTLLPAYIRHFLLAD